MLKIIAGVILTIAVGGYVMGYAIKDRVGALLGESSAKVKAADPKPADLTVDQLKQKALTALESSELKLVDLRAKSNLQRRELVAAKEKVELAEENLSAKAKRVAKLAALAEYPCDCSISGHTVSRSDWIIQRDRETTEKQSLEADVKARRMDVAKRTALLQELDGNLTKCMSEIRSSRDAIDRAANACTGSEAREQLAALIALSSGEKYRSEVNEAVTELQRRAMEGDARADVVLMPTKGIASEFSNTDLDVAMSERAVQTRR